MDIKVYQTHTEISPYEINSVPKLEKMLSKYDAVRHKYIPIGYYYDNDSKTLYLPKGVSTLLLQKFFGKILGDQQWMDQYYPTGGAAPISEQVDQEQLSFNPGFEDIRARIFRETPDQQKQRLNQKVIDYVKFKMKNPNFLFNDYIDDEIRDINRYKNDRLIT